ncbi:uncharacterized protein [Linepithema humile]|uniref:uncharacterized protein n=1 Tax=Linepithema humile TaxID=83485 RepID=UPI00062356A3|nr:PREDICTED: uncharacterized protein LOC105677982 [Linepithema humile]
MKWCVLVLAFASVSRGDKTSLFVCPELNAQEEIDLDKIMGKWYVVEILEHRSAPKLISNSYVVDTCPIVNLRSLLDQASLKLLWTEGAGNLEYTFRIPDISRRKGYWQSIGLQNGTLAEREYRQFAGNVHVMKAVASDMVLTFCARSPDSQLYSLLLSREHNFLQKSDKRGVHNLLGRRGLQIGSIRETCVNGGAGFRRGALDLITWTTLVGLLSSSFLFRSWQ